VQPHFASRIRNESGVEHGDVLLVQSVFAGPYDIVLQVVLLCVVDASAHLH